MLHTSNTSVKHKHFAVGDHSCQCHLFAGFSSLNSFCSIFLWILCLVAWAVSTVAVVRVTAIYFVEKNYVDKSTSRFLQKCHLSSRKILDLLSNKKYIFWNLHKYILQFGQIYLAIFRNKLCNLDKFVNVETHFLKKCHLSSCKILDLL